MIRAAIIAVAVAFVALLAIGLATNARDKTIDDALERGRAPVAPSFALPLLDPGSAAARLGGRERVSLAALRGTPVVLSFWGSRCAPCRAQAPALERAWRQRIGPLLFVGIASGDAPRAARAALRELRTSYPTLIDRGGDVLRGYGEDSVPQTYFLSARGRIVAHLAGAATAREIAHGIAATRSGRPFDPRDDEDFDTAPGSVY